MTIRFIEKVYDEQIKLKQTNTSFITYDMKQQKILKIEELFRSDYLVQLQTMFNEIPEHFQIEEQGIRCFDKDGNELPGRSIKNYGKFSIKSITAYPNTQ